MRLTKYLFVVLLCYSSLVSEVMGQKINAQSDRVNLTWGGGSFTIPRDRGDFTSIWFTGDRFSSAWFFNKITRWTCSTLETKVILEPLGITSKKGNPLFKIPSLPMLGLELMLWDRRGEKWYSYTDQQWHKIFYWCGNSSSAQGMSAQFRLVLLDTPEARTSAEDSYSLDSPLLIGYIKSNSYRNRTMTELVDEGSDEIPIYINPFTLKRNISSCTYRNGNLTVPLPTVNKSSFNGIQSEIFGGTFTLDLDQCGVLQENGSLQASIKEQFGNSNLNEVYVTFTDVTNPSNRTSELTLTSDSTATGVNLRIYLADSSRATGTQQWPLNFGPDSRLKGNQNAKMMNYNSTSKTASNRYVVKYVQTGQQVTPGSVNAIASFTFSYQ